MEQYLLEPQVKIYFPSDGSGVILFDELSGVSLALDSRFVEFIKSARSSPFSKQALLSALAEDDDGQGEKLWHTLNSSFFLRQESPGAG